MVRGCRDVDSSDGWRATRTTIWHCLTALPLAYHTKYSLPRRSESCCNAKGSWLLQAGLRRPAYHSEVHHVTPWTTTHRTDINDSRHLAAPTIALSKKAEDLQKRLTATPNGYHHHTRPRPTANKSIPPPRENPVRTSTTTNHDTQQFKDVAGRISQNH